MNTGGNGTSKIISDLHKSLIVSCQARGENPLSGPQYMLAMARAAQMGGAAGIRAEGPDDVRAISRAVDLPVIGLYKVTYVDSPVYITPTMREVEDIIRAGADIVAIDATMRPRPFGEGEAELVKLVEFVHSAGKLAMADISNLDEALRAENYGFDLVSTTLSGYTSGSPAMPGPDIDLVRNAATSCQAPVIAEGRYWSPADAHQALEVGAHAVVVGTAITNPWKTTEHFINGMKFGMGNGMKQS